ncbi:MAG: hypothetical protein ACM3SR_02635 [Ignavibacteriales bacterium]
MIQIELTSEKAEMLREIISTYLSDLRMEIADTENMNFRENLKKKEEFLNELLQRLEKGET